ncbi:MAG: Gfo/Idh/MocA family oxidoreductase [Tannerellaceae bacterium]|nr:Gfo/Idh/MocA family oxidoreductase [Tannerellaceae bacterium]
MKTRRDFIKTMGLASAGLLIGANTMSAKSYGRIMGANDRIRVALFGCNRRFFSISQALTSCENVDVLYVSDVDSRRQDAAVARVSDLLKTKPKGQKDLRKILEDKEVDAIFNMTPDHWHAPAAWLALEAGKHVYTEKPVTHNPSEGEALLRYQARYPDRLIQVGTQQRSSAESKEIIGQIHAGELGEVYEAETFYINNRERVNNPRKVAVPDFLDWELFQGPAPRTDFMDIWQDYMWHWYWQYGTAESGNNAMHELDIARWALQVQYPEEVASFAYKNHFKDDGWTMYDTMDVVFTFPGDKLIKWKCQCRNGYKTFGSDRGTIVYGTQGTVVINRDGYEVFDLRGRKIRESKSSAKSHSTALGGSGDGLDALHPQNFFAAIRGKEKLNSSLEQGVVSTLLCHLANISYKEGNRPLAVDTSNGHLREEEVQRRHWAREYQKGWEPR